MFKMKMIAGMCFMAFVTLASTGEALASDDTSNLAKIGSVPDSDGGEWGIYQDGNGNIFAQGGGEVDIDLIPLLVPSHMWVRQNSSYIHYYWDENPGYNDFEYDGSCGTNCIRYYVCSEPQNVDEIWGEATDADTEGASGDYCDAYYEKWYGTSSNAWGAAEGPSPECDTGSSPYWYRTTENTDVENLDYNDGHKAVAWQYRVGSGQTWYTKVYFAFCPV
jgi:hypothetical protein